jgi:hypothetical protein
MILSGKSRSRSPLLGPTGYAWDINTRAGWWWYENIRHVCQLRSRKPFAWSADRSSWESSVSAGWNGIQRRSKQQMRPHHGHTSRYSSADQFLSSVQGTFKLKVSTTHDFSRLLYSLCNASRGRAFRRNPSKPTDLAQSSTRTPSKNWDQRHSAVRPLLYQNKQILK